MITGTLSGVTGNFTITCTNASGAYTTASIAWTVVTAFSYPSQITLAPSSSFDFTSAVTAATPIGESYVSIVQTAGDPLPTGWTLDSTNKRLTTATGATGQTAANVRFALNTQTTAASDFRRTRISRGGVVWYHNFDTNAEVDQFRWSAQAARWQRPERSRRLMRVA